MNSRGSSPDKKTVLAKDNSSIFSQLNEERSNLLAIMEKNEKILSMSQATLAKDKQNLINELRSTESLYKSQILSLTEEKKAYILEISRLNQSISALTEKNSLLANELQKAKEKQEKVSQSFLDCSSKLAKVQEKYLKLDKFSKEKELKLQNELAQAKSSLSSLESEVSKKLDQLAQKPQKKENGVSRDHLAGLVQQKNEIEKAFLQEKQVMVFEINKLKKQLKSSQKETEIEKLKNQGFRSQILEIKEQETAENKSREDQMKEFQTLLIETEEGFKQKLFEVKQEMIEREEEMTETLEALQKDYTEYKERTEELINTQTEFKDYLEIIQVLESQFRKIKNLKKSINVNLDCVGKAVKDFYSLTPYSFLQSANNEYSSDHLKVFEDMKKVLKSVKSFQIKLENQSNAISQFFESYNEEVKVQETQRVQDLVALQSENLSLSKKLSEQLQSSLSKLDQKEVKSNKLNEVLEETNRLLLTLKKKISSFKVKKNSELETWALREALYKKTIQSLNTQLSIQNSQFQDCKKLFSLRPDSDQVHISELQKELAEKRLALQVVSEDLSALLEKQKNVEASFSLSIGQIEMSNEKLVDFYVLGLDLIEKLKKSLT